MSDIYNDLWAPEPGDKDYIPKTIDLIPNWKAAATIYIMAFEANCGGRTEAKAGIMEMAEKFDALIDSMKPEAAPENEPCDICGRQANCTVDHGELMSTDDS